MQIDLEEALRLAQTLAIDGVVLEDETAQQIAEVLRQLPEKTRRVIIKGRDTARSFRQAADTLDEMWNTANKGHAAGTSIGIVGGLLTLGGGIATIMAAGAAMPLLMLGMGVGFAGAGINVAASYIEAAMNSTSIQKAEKDWIETLKYINDVKTTVQKLQSQGAAMRLFKCQAERHLEMEQFSRRFTSSFVIGCAHGIDKVAQGVAKAAAQAIDDVAQTAAKIGAQTADDVAQAVAKVAAQATDDVGQAGANVGKFAGGVIIGVSAVFLVWDVYDLGFTIRDLLKKKGSDAAKALRAKAAQLERLCSFS